ncbi:thiamine diphosphokinase [Saccharomycopsis crataegensis]|uniref:Thiamine pyrophosphokinase n=1 Tax=Saccharomycopsis crataegensis TaxID=43959 RepID=A0AAV5QFX2_9ASCO|nr:thiamine diphosphokinase [Saccharomycopsis crataegensis]
MATNNSNHTTPKNIVTENPDFGMDPVTIPSSVEAHNIYDLSTTILNKPPGVPPTAITSRLSALLILNQPITLPFEAFSELFRSASLIVCADGGANQLHDYCLANEQINSYVPNFIVGDLDSLKDDVEKTYQKLGVLVKKQGSQYATDFQKGLAMVDLYFKLGKELGEEGFGKFILDDEIGLVNINKTVRSTGNHHHDIMVNCLGALGGRFDHTIQSMNQLHKSFSESPNLQLYYIGDQDIVFYLPPGENYIKVPCQMKEEWAKDYSSNGGKWKGNTCGILPIFEKVILTTKGLKWDVEEWESGMGGNISSSNRLLNGSASINDGDDWVVYVKSNGALLINIEW